MALWYGIVLHRIVLYCVLYCAVLVFVSYCVVCCVVCDGYVWTLSSTCNPPHPCASQCPPYACTSPCPTSPLLVYLIITHPYTSALCPTSRLHIPMPHLTPVFKQHAHPTNSGAWTSWGTPCPTSCSTCAGAKPPLSLGCLIGHCHRHCHSVV